MPAAAPAGQGRSLARGRVGTADAHRDGTELRGRLRRDRRRAGRLREGRAGHRVRARGLQLRRGQPARLPGRPDQPGAARLRHPAAVLAHPDADRDDRGRPGLRVRRPVHARHRRVRPAGDRGLARRAVRRAGGPDPRDHRDLPQGVAPRAAQLPGQVLHHPAAAGSGHRPGQAAQADQPPGPGAHPDRGRRDRPEERRAGRRAGRGLGADLLLPGEGRAAVGRAAGRRAGPGAIRRSARWRCSPRRRWPSART